MSRSTPRGVISNIAFLSAGSEIGVISSWMFCFKCFFSQLIEPRAEQDNTPLLMFSDPLRGIMAYDPDRMTTNLKDPMTWLKDIHPAQNWMEQNIVILPERDYLHRGGNDTSMPVMCERHGCQPSVVYRLRFIALRDIYLGNELLAWPDILFGLSIGLPFLVPKNIKSPTCYLCDECGIEFSNPNSLKSHLLLQAEFCRSVRIKMMTQTLSESPKPATENTCSFCGRYYARRYSLKIHERTHTGLKPLKCKICERRFGDPSNLNKHLRTHGIGGNIESKSGLKNPYICKICEKICVRRRDFDRHMRRNHGVESKPIS